jgi:hypothetical protein
MASAICASHCDRCGRCFASGAAREAHVLRGMYGGRECDSPAADLRRFAELRDGRCLHHPTGRVTVWNVYHRERARILPGPNGLPVMIRQSPPEPSYALLSGSRRPG